MKLIYSLIIAITFILSFNIFVFADTDIVPDTKEEIGQVIEIINETNNNSLDVFNQQNTTQTVKLKVISGEKSGNVVVTENILSGNPAYDIPVKKGDRVIVNIDSLDGKTEYNISNLYRFPMLIILLSIFIILVLIFGGITGLKSLISLGFTYFLIFYFLIPNILNGHPPLLITITICFLATCGTVLLIAGVNYKSLTAIIGTLGGVIAAGIMAIIAINIAPLTGLPNHEAIGLWTEFPDLNFKGILASAMIIGALGASMDVSISIASSILEVKKANQLSSMKDLIKSGMNVGKDIMGTMTNTLLLAYTGSGIFLLLIVYKNVSLTKLLNLDSVVTEITAALAGSIGLVLCIPITALAGGYLISFSKTKEARS